MTSELRRVVVGTAGHVDHGKTRLVEALTGVDCDRWEEEKRRGITIDLGFAHFVAGDLQVGFVDVPGHEKFLHNALAGLGGIRVMLLVVAADEGVQPQTREHLAVCELLEIPAAVIALTKNDRVDADRLAATEAAVDALLADGPYAAARRLPVSAVTGDGVEALREALVEVGSEHAQQPDRRPARLPIDRVFKLKGHGRIVTGTLAAGALARGATLVAEPGGAQMRIRNLQVHGEDRPTAATGERVALQLGGEGGALARGVQLVAPGALHPGLRWLVRLRLLPEAPKPIRGSTEVRVHLLSSEGVGKLRPLSGAIEPGATGVAAIHLSAPMVAARGDRFIVRRPSPATTLGGGRLLDPQWRPLPAPAVGTAIEALDGDDRAALAYWVARAGEGGVATSLLAARLGTTVDATLLELEALAAEQQVVRAGDGDDPAWLVPDAFAAVERRARQVLADYFNEHRMRDAMPRAEAVAAILPGRAADLADAYLPWLAERKVLAVDGDRVTLPGRGAELTGGESKLATQILAAYEAAGLTPPSPGDVRAALGGKAQILDGVTTHLLERGRLTRLPGGLLIATAALERLRDELRAGPPDDLTVGDFKQRFGLTRKWAIPLLEHLDSAGVTRRVGNLRQIVR